MLDKMSAGGGILEARSDGRNIGLGRKTNGVIDMSDYPD